MVPLTPHPLLFFPKQKKQAKSPPSSILNFEFLILNCIREKGHCATIDSPAFWC